MSLILQLPPGTEFYQPTVTFVAVFNAVTPGLYDWNSPANTGVPFFPIRKNALYIFERYSFSADVPEESFTEALLTIPTLEVRIPAQQNRMIYPRPFPMLNFVDAQEIQISVFSSQDDNLEGTFRGQLTQPAALVGVPDITAICQFNIYEVKNKYWIDNFLGRTKDGQGRNLIAAGGRIPKAC